MEITLEKIELVKDRTGVSYKEAKDALEKAEGSVVDAIIAIEENIDDKKGNKAADMAGNAVNKIKEAVKKGNVSKITVKREDEVLLNIPLNVGIVGAVVAPWGAIAAVIAAFGFKCRIELTQTDGTVVDISEKAMEKTASVREKGAVVVDEIKEKAPQVWENVKDKGQDAWEAAKDSTQNVWESAKDKGQDVWESAKDKGQDAWEAAKDSTQNVWENVKDKTQDVIEEAKEKKPEAFEKLNVFGRKVKEEAEEAEEKIEEAADDVIGKVEELLQRAKDDIASEEAEEDAEKLDEAAESLLESLFDDEEK